MKLTDESQQIVDDLHADNRSGCQARDSIYRAAALIQSREREIEVYKSENKRLLSVLLERDGPPKLTRK